MTTRWLTRHEQRAWRAFLEAATGLFDDLDRQLQRDAGLSHGDYEILVRLSEADGQQVRMSDLATQTYFSRSRLSHAVGRLEATGLVARVACETDRRGTFAVLTPEGGRRLDGVAPGHVAAVRRLLFDNLTADQVAQLHAIASAVTAARRGA